MARGKTVAFLLLLAAATASASADASCDAENADEGSRCAQKGAAPVKKYRSNSMLQVGSSNKMAQAVSDSITEDEVDAAAVEVTTLNKASFAQGTYRITAPGKYTLSEDIEFSPTPPGQWSSIPPDSPKYPQLAGYFLGFFTALSIEANDVELDCAGKEIKMSTAFHKRQRFFSIIELGSSPFPAGAGPPQFASTFTTPASPVFATNVVIKNCKLGLSSHHSIHGNNNAGVTVQNTQMYDFEVGGVSLNGASNVVLEGLTIGPSLKMTFGAGLSQSVFLDHLAGTLMDADPIVKPLKQSTTVKLRGQQYTAQAVFDALRTSLQEYVQKGTGPLLPVAGDGQQLPDGSAVYGILLHRAGPAVGALGVCPDDLKDSLDDWKNIKLKDIKISDLAVKVDQVTNYVVNGKIVAGPAGDVFQVVRAWNPSGCFEYVGNVLMDAEIAMGVLCEDLADKLPIGEFKAFCGGTYVPASVRAWASGDQQCPQTKAWAESLTKGTHATEKLTCLGDAMNHHNKGAIALRLGFQSDVTAENVVIENVVNAGVANAAPFCAVTDYEGVDVRGTSLAHVKGMQKFDVKQQGTLQGSDPQRVFPITRMLQMRADDGSIDA